MTGTENNEVYDYLVSKYGEKNVSIVTCNGNPNGVYSVKLSGSTLYVNGNSSLNNVNLLMSCGGQSAGDDGELANLMQSSNPLVIEHL